MSKGPRFLYKKGKDSRQRVGVVEIERIHCSTKASFKTVKFKNA